jgi:peptide/nickel transport system substrate-binding protein
VREALNSAVDRKLLVDQVLGGLYRLITQHFNRRWLIYNLDIFEKKEEMENNRNVLPFSLSTSNAPELKRSAEILKEIWEKVGRVEVKIFETGDLNQNVIRPRKYDSLLFGEVIGRDLDLFAFWHSSQRNDPGLNIAMYTNVQIDKILENARTLTTTAERLKSYQNFAETIVKETPAIFLYSPDFVYVLPERIKGVELRNITIPSDRFVNVFKWFIDSENVWKFFVH